MTRLLSTCLLAALTAASLACGREARAYRQPPALADPANGIGISVSDLYPGGVPPAPPPPNPLAGNIAAIAEGKQLFLEFNCVGCHANGGGAIGPPLIKKNWIYGSEPANLHATILEGRPNGMPSWRGKIQDAQVWALVAYIRSLNGFTGRNLAMGRGDHLAGRPPGMLMPHRKPGGTTGNPADAVFQARGEGRK